MWKEITWEEYRELGKLGVRVFGTNLGGVPYNRSNDCALFEPHHPWWDVRRGGWQYYMYVGEGDAT